AHPAAGPARGRGDERVLHHPDDGEATDGGALYGPSAAREAPRGTRHDRTRDGQAGLVGVEELVAAPLAGQMRAATGPELVIVEWKDSAPRARRRRSHR